VIEDESKIEENLMILKDLNACEDEKVFRLRVNEGSKCRMKFMATLNTQKYILIQSVCIIICERQYKYIF
jgi:uncharacterized protein with PhoU and TrkA domain